MACQPITIANCKTTPEATVAATARTAWASLKDRVSFVMRLLHELKLIGHRQIALAVRAQQTQFLTACLGFLNTRIRLDLGMFLESNDLGNERSNSLVCSTGTVAYEPAPALFRTQPPYDRRFVRHRCPPLERPPNGGTHEQDR
jgi:hypothetical protein